MRTTPPLYYITINLTYQCNLSCEFCYNPNHSIKNELSTDDVESIIDQARDLGVKTILFTGGEPLLRSDLFRIMERAKASGMYVCLATNGILINEKIINRFDGLVDKLNIGSGGVFMDNLTAPSNDKLREKLEKLSKVTKVTLNCTIFNKNAHQLPSLAEFCKEYSIELNLKRFIPSGLGENVIDLSPEDHNDLLIKVSTLAKNGYRISFKSDPIYGVEERNSHQYGGCLAGIHTISIAPQGDVIICTKVPSSIGNIRNHSLFHIWNNSETLKKLRDREVEGKCGTCKYRWSCGGCRASAYAISGNIFGEDSVCSRYEKSK